MCGIAGILNLAGEQALQVDAIKRMTDCMVNRGPDDEGFILMESNGEIYTYCGDDTPSSSEDLSNIIYFPEKHIKEAGNKQSILALGHRRLSIIDLSLHGHQPMCTSDGNYWIVYNGEIYNYREIAAELRANGINLQSNSDTEVLINAYAVWGERCLDKLNGMFAFAIWDRHNRSLFCARDRIGIKPFYYTIQNNQFIFASDIKTLIASKLYKAIPDSHGLYLSMAYGMAPRPLTAFRDIHALEQGHWMKVYGEGRIDKHRYWCIPTNSQDNSLTEADAKVLLEEQLTAAVKRCLVADVAIGTYMSGGIDSTIISSIASTLHPGIKAFTLGYQHIAPDMDEVREAVATAKMHSMEHIIYQVEDEYNEADILRLASLYEEPHYGMGANNIISGLARKNGVSVILNGLGGDELFAGYEYYALIPWWHFLKPYRKYIKFFRQFAGMYRNKLTELCNINTADEFHSIVYANMLDSDLRPLFNTGKDQEKFETPRFLHNLYVDDLKFTDDIEAVGFMDMMNYVGNHHVHRIDQFTMANSIEGRFPFLDHEFVETAFSIPSNLKIHNKVQKYILRKVAEKYIAKESFAMKKQGFSLPLKQWMSGKFRSFVSRRLNNLKQRECINPQVIDLWEEQYLSNKRSHKHIWGLVSLDVWFERFID